MIEFPIIIAEERGEEFGVRVSMPIAGLFQLSVHEVDPRPGFNRLLNTNIHALNVSVARFWSSYEDSGFIGLLRTSNRYVYWDTFLGSARWQNLCDAVQAGVLGGWLPEQVEEDEAIPYALCVECQLPVQMHSSPQELHADCAVTECNALLPLSMMNRIGVRMASNVELVEYQYVCQEHAEDFIEQTFQCRICSHRAETALITPVNYGHQGVVSVCAYCAEWSISYCQEGEHYRLNEDFEWSGAENCWECRQGLYDPESFVHSWNYVPALVFHPEVPTNPLRPLYIGMELEMSWPLWQYENAEKAFNWLRTIEEDYSDILYVKSDSSVDDGFEVVTHPMEPQWAKENFPFDFFQKAIDAGAKAHHDSCGTHIHIDKASLTTAQVWKLLKVHSMMSGLLQIIGGRGSTSYADWNGMTGITQSMMEIARKKGEAFGQVARYVPVNVQNEQTLELRYMAGDISPNTIRKNIEWVQALYDFTEEVTVDDIKQGALEVEDFMLGHILSEDYPVLAQYVKTRVRLPQTLPSKVSV